MSAWQPENTAPKDGTLIWVSADGKRFIAFWKQEWSWRKCRVVKSYQALWSPDQPIIEGGNQTSAIVTHWMPLPDLPETK
jgi:hypothetical protein